MKERGLPFMAPMVRAVLAYLKTITRRPVKGIALEWLNVEDFTPEFVANPENHLCPYGVPGDRLWVREHWRTYASLDKLPPSGIQPGAGIQYEAGGTSVPTSPARLEGMGKFRPGMFMCRWMSRILLEVVSVRIERLQDISEADCIAEGIYERPNAGSDPARWKVYGKEDTYTTDPVTSYQSLWEQINGAGSWDLNPWVWVVEFKRITP